MAGPDSSLGPCLYASAVPSVSLSLRPLDSRGRRIQSMGPGATVGTMASRVACPGRQRLRPRHAKDVSTKLKPRQQPRQGSEAREPLARGPGGVPREDCLVRLLSHSGKQHGSFLVKYASSLSPCHDWRRMTAETLRPGQDPTKTEDRDDKTSPSGQRGACRETSPDERRHHQALYTLDGGFLRYL